MVSGGDGGQPHGVLSACRWGVGYSTVVLERPRDGSGVDGARGVWGRGFERQG